MKLVSVFGLSVLGGLGVLDAVQGRVGDFDNEMAAARGQELVEEVATNLANVDWTIFPEVFQKAAGELESLVEVAKNATAYLTTTCDVIAMGDQRRLQEVIREPLNMSSVLNAHPEIAQLHREFKSNPKTRRLALAHEALMKGDLGSIESRIRSLTKHVHSSLAGGYLREEHGGRRLTKKNQCEELVDVVKNQYSFYDLFVSLYKDNIDEDDGAFDQDATITEGIFEKIKKINLAVEAIVEDSYNNLALCDTLLEQFHTNREESLYAVYQASSVNTVKRGATPATYLSLQSVRQSGNKKFYRQAELLFEDFLVCANSLQRELAPDDVSIFLTQDNSARMPYRVNDPGLNAVDQHGAPKNPLDYDNFFKYNTPDIIAEIFDPANKDVYHPQKDNKEFDTSKAFDDLNEKWSACNKALVLKLTTEFNDKMLRASDLTLDSYKDRQDYSGLAMKCYDKRQDTDEDDAHYPCWVRLYDNGGHADVNYVKIEACEDHKIYTNDCPYRDVGDSCGEGFPTFDSVPLPWTAGGDYDKMATLAFGDDPNDSGALVCRLAEIAESADTTLDEKDVMPGFCCVDRAFDSDRDSDLWGFPYTCGDECKKKAPLFAGFSEGACRVYSGTYCAYPRNCTSLLNCTADLKAEVEPASANETDNPNENLALFDFLTAGPEVNNSTSFYECGQLREYYGFDKDYPIDDDICVDINLLKDSDDFRFINRYNKGHKEDSGKHPVLIVPEKPSYTSAEGVSWREGNFVLSQVVGTIREFYDFLSNAECPAEDASGTACAIVKNIAMGPILTALVVAQSALEISDYTYGEKVGLSDYQMNEIYFNTFVIFENMGKLLTELIYITSIVDANKLTLARIEPVVYAINDTVTENKETLALINATVNEILEIVTPPAFLPGVRNYGCDGIDQNNNKKADECDEDTFAPELIPPHSSGFIVDASDNFVLSHKVFSSSAEAESLLKAVVGVKDDCANEASLAIVISIASVETCSKTFTLTPRHFNRSPCADMYGQPQNFVMKIDPAPPRVTCTFRFASEENDEYLFLEEESSNGKSFSETDFYFAVVDDCSESMNVTVKIKSNEFDSNPMAFLRARVLPGVVEQASIIVSTDPCGSENRYCLGNDTIPRMYEVTVAVTDAVGRSAECVKKVIIHKTKKSQKIDELALIALAESAPSWFVLDSLALVWNASLAPIPII